MTDEPAAHNQYHSALGTLRRELRDASPYARSFALGVVNLFVAAKELELHPEARRAPVVSALIQILSDDLRGR